ncbi:meprin A subunit beta-like isoform X2 [Sinocyclocheilus rhinocerous]|nr:PREDICTED: meprin A subunit beta-like isoform X2 [Sinocyclocheilus rhinocerous]
MGKVTYFWDNPQKVGSLVIDTDGSKFYRGPGNGTSNYITHDRLKSRSFIKGHDAIFLLSLEDVTGLLKTRRPKIRDLQLEIYDRDAEEEPKRQMVNPRVPFKRTMD